MYIAAFIIRYLPPFSFFFFSLFVFLLPSPFSAHRTRNGGEANPFVQCLSLEKKELFIQFLGPRLVKLEAKEIVNNLADEVGRTGGGYSELEVKS